MVAIEAMGKAADLLPTEAQAGVEKVGVVRPHGGKQPSRPYTHLGKCILMMLEQHLG